VITVWPPERLAAVTVQVAEVLEVREVGEQESEDTNAETDKLMLAVAEVLL